MRAKTEKLELERRRKISINNGRGMLGRHHTQESKKKISENLERNKKISEKLKGNKNTKNRIYIKLTEETKNKISKTIKNNYKNGYINPHKNKTLNQIYGKEKAKELRQKYRQNAINTLNKLKKSKISKAELILKRYFIKNNINFIHQWKYKYGITDFFLPDFNMIVECDGEYWHSKPDYIKRDKKKRDYLKRKGYLVFVHSSEKLVKMEDTFK